MRASYIQWVKEFIHSNPDFKNILKEIKAHSASIGATDEEFTEALKQLGVQPVVSNTLLQLPQNDSLKTKKKFSFISRLIELDIITHVVALLILIATASVFLFQYVNSQSTTRKTIISNPLSQKKTVEKKIGNLLTAQVFANTSIVDVERIFSYPPSQITLSDNGTVKKEVLGFFPYWILPKEEVVSLNALTTISLFGLEVDGGGNIVTKGGDGEIDQGWAMWNDPALQNFITRAKRRRIKTLLTLKAFNNENIERLVSSNDAQVQFISNAIHLIDSKSIDGITIDFEYVGTPTKETRDNFSRFIKNLRVEMQRQAPNSLLNVASYISSAAIPRLIDVVEVSQHVDYFVVMGYDMHTPNGQPGPIAPMEGEISIVGYMQSYLEKVTPEKLVLAVAYYGYDWEVPSVSQDSARILPYVVIVSESKNNEILWDEISQTPKISYRDITTNTEREIHFENTRSLGIKYDFVNSKNLRGVAIWALGYDGLNGELRALLIEKFGK